MRLSLIALLATSLTARAQPLEPAAPTNAASTAEQAADAAAANPAPAPAEESTDPLPRAIGPFRIGTAGNGVEVGLAVQLRLTLTSATEATGAAATVQFRRLRVGLRGALLDGRLTFLLQLNTTPAALELIDLWADYRFTASASLRVGQFKTPLTRYRGQSFLDLSLADWPVMATHFGAERQLGLMLHNDGEGDHHWVYQAGLFTGVNARASFARGLATIYSEPMPNPSDLHSPQLPSTVHPELVARVGHQTAGMNVAADSDETGGGLRHAVNVSGAWDLRPSYPLDFPLRLAPELLLKWNHLFLDVVAIVGWYRSGTGGWGVSSVGETVEVGWRFFPRWEVAARFSRVDITAGVRADAAARADALVAAAPPDQQDSVRKEYESAGNLGSTQGVGAALNVYLVGRNLKWQTDVDWLHNVGAVTDNVLSVRTQLQLAF